MNAVPSSQALLETATGLLLDVQAEPGDMALRRRVEAWVATSAEHERAWAEARRTWAMLGDIMPDMPARQTAQIIAFPVRKTRRRLPGRLFGGMAATAAAAALVLALSPSMLLRLRADQATGTGELRDVRLADGSLVRLGARSAIDVDMSRGQRRVRLLAGDAWFDVKRDPSRPFTVQSGAVETRVLGTAFEVRSRAMMTEVGVARGHVRVSAAQGASDLLPGDSVTVDQASGTMRKEHLALDGIASWRDGYVFANKTTIADVIEELRRYDHGWIVLADPALGRQRVTGLYDARDPGKALDALMATAGGRITRITPYITVLRGV